ncbi:hypothetical protein cce_1043 [Crocosphaera subtropica ATCC 51142]|uniref:Uncharacterized protein n=1 Tax=Crocosphaera subtropica (strain ATCC 51142 / BH68) TaxID=43989 RepID=B1WTS8_CROS5|nr:hypothetical protein cce_1043 [Crocosphaera subtropica ATCC 51142]
MITINFCYLILKQFSNKKHNITLKKFFMAKIDLIRLEKK